MINEGIRVEERQFCMLCGSKGATLYQDLRDRLFEAPGTWTLLRCPQCALAWLDPQPIPEDIAKLYSTYYTHDTLPEVPKKGPSQSWRNTVKKSLKSLASRLGAQRDTARGNVMWLDDTRPGKLLDVGCGNGRFLAAMRELGWEVTGVDPDGQAVKVARDAFGLDVRQGQLEEAAFPDDTFDAITMSHVVEHLPDPITTLRECRRVLKQDGRLVVTTPNIESLGFRFYREAWRGLEVPRHLFVFSPANLRACTEEAGLKVLDLRTSARMARWMSSASHLIRTNGVLPGGSPTEQRLGLRIVARLFEMVESTLCRVREVGEEILLRATK